MRIIVTILSVLILFSCEDKSKILETETYEGPFVEMTNIDVLISDSTIVKLRLVAPKQMVFQDDDRDFPEGIYLEFYDILGRMTSTLKADKGHYFAEDDYYKAEGNVIMKSKMEKKELTTELLNWVPEEERIHTDNFVTIVTVDDVITGEGLEATQDFEEYTITKPSGTMLLVGQENLQDDDDGFDPELVFEEDTTAF